MDSTLYLFNIIKSLDKPEKRYFSLQASKNTLKGSNNILDLFKAVELQETYDEQRLFSQLKGKALLKNFAVTKHQLANLILKCMHNYHAHSSADAILLRSLHELEFLQSKKISDYYKKQLTLAKKFAYKHERFSLLIELIQKEYYLPAEKKEIKRIERLDNELKIVQKKNQNLSEHISKLRKTTYLTRKHSNTDVLNKKIGGPIECFSVRAKSLQLAQQIAYAYAQKKYSLVYQYNSQLLLLAEKHPHIIKEDTDFFISILDAHINVCLLLKKYDEALTQIKALRAIKSKISNDKIKIFERSYNAELNLYLETKNYKAAIAILPSFEDQFKKMGDKTSPVLRLLLQCQLANIYFVTGNLSLSLRWINNVLNDKYLYLREELETMARVQDILIHFDLHNLELINYKINSLQYFMKKKERVHNSVTLLLNTLKGIIKTSSDAEKKKLFISLRQDMQKKSDSSSEEHLSHYIDMSSWIESKIHSKPQLEIMRQKN